MNILIVILALSFLILVHEAGHFFAAKILHVGVQEFGIGFPPRIMSVKRNGTRYSINALPLGGFVRLADEFDGAGKSANGFLRQPAWKKGVILVAGVFMNMLAAWLLFTIVFTVGVPEHIVISRAVEGSPAAEAGLQQGDIILGAEKGEVVLETPVVSEEFLALSGNNPEETLSLIIGRNGSKSEVEITGRSNPPEGEGPLGVEFVTMGVERLGFFRGTWAGLEASVQSFGAVAAGFWHLITGAFSGAHVLDTISGPVGVFVVAQSVSMLGVIYLAQLFAVISVNLAVLNLLPFPALDGGRLLFVGIEKLRGRPVSSKVQAWCNTAGFAALLILMIIVTFKDLGRFVF